MKYAGLTEYATDYCRHYTSTRERTPLGVGPWLSQLRENGWKAFSKNGFPTMRNEDWKYLKLDELAAQDFEQGGWIPPEVVKELEPLADHIPFMDCYRMVFAEGLYVPELSSVGRGIEGVTISPMSAALHPEQDRLTAALGSLIDVESMPLAALNTALFGDGAFVHLKKAARLDRPLHLVFISGVTDRPVVTHPRSLFIVDEAAEMEVIESYLSASGKEYFTNAVTEMVLARSAVLNHHQWHETRPGDSQFHTLAASVAGRARMHTESISFGEGLTRSDIETALTGPDAEALMNGVFHTDGDGHFDLRSIIEHCVEDCRSFENYGGILDGNSSGSFNGTIKVFEDAQRTDSKQSSRNLLLSENARMNTRPQLEIFADDVKCTHGATIGQLDKDALFYLKARGISEQAGRRLLVQGFARERLEEIVDPEIREHATRRLMERI